MGHLRPYPVSPATGCHLSVGTPGCACRLRLEGQNRWGPGDRLATAHAGYVDGSADRARPQSRLPFCHDPKLKLIELFASGKIDAFLAFAPEPQELRARKIGHVLVNTALDRPWSQYFCCLLVGNREFVRNYPAATKRALRAILKAADLCATDPARAAQRLVDGGFTPRYDYAFDALSGLPYDKWREYDAEDTLRFYALRLRETGFTKSSPQRIIADGTDWRFLDELKRELKT